MWFFACFQSQMIISTFFLAQCAIGIACNRSIIFLEKRTNCETKTNWKHKIKSKSKQIIIIFSSSELPTTDYRNSSTQTNRNEANDDDSSILNNDYILLFLFWCDECVAVRHAAGIQIQTHARPTIMHRRIENVQNCRRWRCYHSSVPTTCLCCMWKGEESAASSWV